MSVGRTLIALGVLLVPLAVVVNGCSEDEEPEVLEPSEPAPPAPEPRASVDIEPEEEEEEEPEEEEEEEPKPKAKGPFDPAGIGMCCIALEQNANSAPPNQVPLYQGAAKMCHSLKNNPNARGQLYRVRQVLAGAGVPNACQ